VDLKGLVLVNRDFGYCKITSHSVNTVQIRFIGTGRDACYSVQAIAAQKDFKWRPMPVGLQCHTLDNRVCTIVEASFQPSETCGVYEYVVVFEGDAGETARLNERDLWPIPGTLSETPLSKIVGLQSDPLTNFRAREGLLAALQQVDRESSGIRALAASRVSLLPHQAFVIGSVIDDPIWRYVLADEVGLGKTIEAGSIAHQLLSEKPDARVLILCPGPLSRQWLSEMHSSFGGRNFRLLDLHEPEQVSLKAWPLVISSLKLAAWVHRVQMLATAWDLVIVDEAHQLLWNDDHYKLVEQLAGKVHRLLLLSAVPARERETELMRLLRLIEPGLYREGGLVASRFTEVYAAQPTIGRRLRIVARQLDNPDDLDPEQLHEDVGRLLSIDVLREDLPLRALQQVAQSVENPSDALPHYQQLIDEVVSRYRISRRILKNRRARLIDAELLHGVTRTVELVHYEPSPLEAQISAVVLDLLQPMTASPNVDVLQVLFRKVAQALCDPVALYEIASALFAGGSDTHLDMRMFDANAAFDYDEHDAVLEGCGTAFSSEIDESGLNQWKSLLRAAIEVPEHSRIGALKTCLQKLLANGAGKVLVFAGTYGSAEYVAEALEAEFGKESIASFRHDQDDDTKEKQVGRFRRDSHCSILVSDESGGEGRNFQFADELIHFDLPWSVSAIEQRIGRLDRIGRDRPVRSFVICPTGGLEAAWFRCLDEGFGVFTRSISGLEFMLHGIERLVVKTAVEEGFSALIDMIPGIREAGERERATDDAEALTDAASFRSTTRYLRASECVGDGMLEKYLPPYFRALGRGEAARRVTDHKDINLRIWRLRPEEVSDYKLVGLERQGENPLQERYGTFSRLVARDRRDLDFFAVGHPVIDALAVATREHVRGRSLLVRIQTDAVPPGLVLLSAWRVSDLQQGGPNPIPERALRLLCNRCVWAALDLATGEALDAVVAERIVGQLMSETGAASDLSQDGAINTFNPEQGRWSATLKELLDITAAQATATYQKKYGEKDVTFCDQLTAVAEEVSRTRLDEGTEYVQSTAAVIEAVKSAKLVLDVLALLKIEPPTPA
jgi:ATP-dependent helicase HepA